MKPVTNVLLPLYLVVKYLKSVLILFNLDAIQQSLEEFIYQDCNKQNQLYQLQSKILQELADANPDTILDNTRLIENLEVSKIRSKNVKEALEEAEQVEIVIN